MQELIGYFPIVAILGPRQCGKTTLLRELGDSWSYYDLESSADWDQISIDPELFLRLNSEKVAIDEAQLMPELFSALRIAVDNDRSKTGRYVITGSSSPDLIRGISESLAGRVGFIEMSPLLLSEISGSKMNSFYRIFEGDDSNECLKEVKGVVGDDVMQKFWMNGGYPEPWVKSSERFRKLWYGNYYKTYLERDIAKLFPGLSMEKYRLFIQLLAGLSGQIINYSNVGRSLSVSSVTAKEYFEIAHNTYIWRTLRPYERNVQKRIVKHPKGYLRDTGLLHYLLRIADSRQLLSHPMMGSSWEILVIEQILRKLNSLGIDYNYYYYRTGNGAEVDLVLEGDFGIIPVEIKYKSGIKKNDLHSISEFRKEHECAIGIVINNDTKLRWYEEFIVGIPFSFIC